MKFLGTLLIGAVVVFLVIALGLNPIALLIILLIGIVVRLVNK